MTNRQAEMIALHPEECEMKISKIVVGVILRVVILGVKNATYKKKSVF